MKKLIVTLSLAVPLAMSGMAYAATVPSDFARDVTEGTNQLNSDPLAKTQANAVNDGEHAEGQIDDGQVEVNETVGDQEGNMDSGQQGESSDSSTNSNGDTVGASTNSGSATTSNGGTNQ